MMGGGSRILLITPGNIGDVVLTLPVLDMLNSHYPGSDVHVLTSPSAAGVFKEDKRVAEVMQYEKRSSLRKKISLTGKLR